MASPQDNDNRREDLKDLEGRRLKLLGQMDELSQEAAEHRLVLKTLTTLPQERRCYRIVGGVAVERTVGEVAPALESHAEKIEQLHKKFVEQLESINDKIKNISANFSASSS